MPLKCDSRFVQPGDTFVAVRGAHCDGSHFIHQAIQAGAAEIISDLPRPPSGIPESVRWKTVPDTRLALAELACTAYGNPSHALQIFGITGTNGKTTTATLLREILTEAQIPTGLLSTISYITTPADASATSPTHERPATNTTPGSLELQALFAAMHTDGCQACVMEVSSHAIDQKRIAYTQFKAIAFTHLTQDHLDYHGSLEAYFEAKQKLFIPPQFPAAINLDCPYGRRLYASICATPHHPPVLSFGSSPECDVSYSHARLDASGTQFHLTFPTGEAEVKLNLLGRHNILNALCAFSLATLAQIPAPIALSALSRARPVRGRLERIQHPLSPATFFVDYAHTPDAIENVLKTLREITPNRLFILFGAGGDRDRKKRPLMGLAAAQLADYCILTSDNPRSEDPTTILNEIQAGIPPARQSAQTLLVEPNRRTAIEYLLALANEPGDVALIAGKGHETIQIFAHHTEPFDDREVLLASHPRELVRS